jgi:hypothetical protein
LKFDFDFENGFGFEMAKEFSNSFYNSQRWRKTARAYAESRHYVCERCGNQSFRGKKPKRERFIVHHKILLTPENITDDQVTCNWDNLELLCICCHNKIHDGHEGRECLFDDDGNPIGIVEHVHTGHE